MEFGLDILNFSTCVMSFVVSELGAFFCADRDPSKKRSVLSMAYLLKSSFYHLLYEHFGVIGCWCGCVGRWTLET